MSGNVQINLSAEEIQDIMKSLTSPARAEGQAPATNNSVPEPPVVACGIAICGNGKMES